jgi:hypothetical protein
MSGRRCDNGPVDEPLLKVVKGDPTPAELAAVVSAVSAKLAAAQSTTAATPTASAGSHPRASRQATGWAAYWRNVRQPLQPGPGAWRRSALPG